MRYGIGRVGVVGVDPDYGLTARRLDAGLEGRSLASIALVPQQARGEIAGYAGSCVRGAVVDNDDLDAVIGDLAELLEYNG